MTLNSKIKYRYLSHNTRYFYMIRQVGKPSFNTVSLQHDFALPRAIGELEKLEKSVQKRERNANFYVQAASFDVS
jgi:hypothetical protein